MPELMTAEQLTEAIRAADVTGLTVRELWPLHVAAKELADRAVHAWAHEAKKNKGPLKRKAKN